jgi:hypothetical protein
MKLLLSSKVLASKLNEIDFETDEVKRVSLNDNELMLITLKKSVVIPVHVVIFKASENQEGRGWDCVRSLVSRVEEQPIVLQIYDNVLNVIFQY